jgi:hypothetical protein
VDEQAGGTFVADRNGNLVAGGVRGGIERNDPGELAVQIGDRHAIGARRPRAVADGDGDGRAADVPPQQPAMTGDGEEQAGRRVLPQLLAANALVEGLAGQVDIEGRPSAHQAAAGQQGDPGITADRGDLCREGQRRRDHGFAGVQVRRHRAGSRPAVLADEGEGTHRCRVERLDDVRFCATHVMHHARSPKVTQQLLRKR